MHINVVKVRIKFSRVPCFSTVWRILFICKAILNVVIILKFGSLFFIEQNLALPHWCWYVSSDALTTDSFVQCVTQTPYRIPIFHMYAVQVNTNICCGFLLIPFFWRKAAFWISFPKFERNFLNDVAPFTASRIAPAQFSTLFYPSVLNSK